MSIFLYSYDDPSHYREAERYGVIGARKTESPSLNSRLARLHRDDWIVLRDSSEKDFLRLLGCHRVLADVWEQTPESPFRDLLWQDEKLSGTVIYEFRIVVDPQSIPCAQRVNWGDLDMGATKQTGGFLESASEWSALFRGNFISRGHAPATLLSVLGLPNEFLDYVA